MKLGHLCTPWGGQLPGADGFLGGVLFTYISWLAMINAISILISTGGGVVTDEKRTPCISIAQCCAPRGRNANPLRMDKARKLKLSEMID